MIKVLFVCHGNICRSTMAEFVFKDMARKEGIAKKFYIASAATSNEEIGNHIHYGTRNKLNEVGIPFDKNKVAVRIVESDYDKYDYLIGMDYANIRNMKRVFDDEKGKVFRLLEFSGEERDIADPWYTGNFDVTYNDITKGLAGFLDFLKQERLI